MLVEEVVEVDNVEFPQTIPPSPEYRPNYRPAHQGDEDAGEIIEVERPRTLPIPPRR